MCIISKKKRFNPLYQENMSYGIQLYQKKKGPTKHLQFVEFPFFTEWAIETYRIKMPLR